MIILDAIEFNEQSYNVEFDSEYKIFSVQIGDEIYTDISYNGLLLKLKLAKEKMISLKWIKCIEFEVSDRDDNCMWGVFDCWIAFHPYESTAYRTYNDPEMNITTIRNAYAIRTDKKSLPFSAFGSEYVEFNQEWYDKLNHWQGIMYRFREAASIDTVISLAQQYLRA